MIEFKKPEKKYLNMLASKSYERALAAALEELYEYFQQWKENKTNIFVLNQSIHEFHDHTARELYKFYHDLNPEMIVSHAIAEGILKEDEVEEKYLTLLKQHIAYFKEENEQTT